MSLPFTSNRIINLAHFMILFAILITLSYSAAIKTSDTHISTTRNAYRASICSFYSGTYSSSDIESTKNLISQYKYLSNAEIEDILFSQNLSSMNSNTILNVAPHIIGLAVCAILWIPLCFCCVWPQKHPACQKCRKPQKENYGHCQLKWTAYTTLLFYLVVAIASVLAVVQGPNIVLFFNDIGCKVTAVGDDLVNGRLSPTVQNRFFTGLGPYSTDLTSFKTNFNTIWTQSQNSLNNAGNLRTKQTFYQTRMNNTYSSYNNEVYTDAFSVNGTLISYQPVTSAFKTMHYGPTTNSSTILGNMYSTSSVIFNEINKVMDPMIAAWANLTTATQSGVNNQMTATLASSANLQTNINDFQSKLGKFFNNQSLYSNLVLILKAFYGCFFGLALLGGVAAILIACFSVVRVRLIMYFTCGIMYFLSIFSFIFLIILSFIMPNLSQVCSYMDAKFATGGGTYDFFSKMGWSQMGNLTKNCMSDGTGWMINQLQPTFNTSFANLVTITNNVQLLGNLTPSYSTSNFVTPVTQGSAIATKVMNAKLLEINDPIALNFIDGVRLITYPPLNCNPSAVNDDSWMPSYDLYTCPAGKAQNNPCGNLASTATCPAGCYEIMNQLQSTAGDTSYATSLQTRYGASCNYYTFIRRLQENWNVKRRDNMNNTVLPSLTTLLSDVTAYDNYYKTILANVSTFSTILQTNFDGTTNLTAGTFNGMDCRVMGQTIMDFRNAVCAGFLGSVYFNFVVLILISYGSLMIACCGTCTGVRHFKHLQRMKINIGYKGVPVAISEQRIFDNEK